MSVNLAILFISC